MSAILEATKQLFVVKGLTSLNINQVADRAGVGVGSLYEYFANKEALVKGLIEQFAERIEADLNSVFNDRGDDDLDRRLSRLVRVIVDVYDQDSDFHAKLLRHVPFVQGDNPLDLIDEPIRRRFAGMLRAYASETQVSDPDRAALVCVRAVRGMIDAACADPSLGIKPRDIENEMVTMTRRYLMGGP